MTASYREHIDRANIRFTNIKNSYDISNRLKSNADEFLQNMKIWKACETRS